MDVELAKHTALEEPLASRSSAVQSLRSHSTSGTEDTRKDRSVETSPVVLLGEDKLVEAGDYDKQYDAYVRQFRTKRWVLLIVFALQSIFCGPTFFNFAPFQDIYFKDKAYAGYCHPGDELDDKGHCLAQRQRVAAILPAAVSCMFSFSFAGGIIIDTFGTKVSACFGMLSQLLGWILIGSSSPSLDGYKIGSVFLGMGIDPMFIALLSISNLFEGWQNTVISTLGTMRSLSMGVGMVFREIPNASLKALGYGYAAIVFVFLIATVSLVPWKPFLQREDFIAAKNAPEATKQTFCQHVKEELKTQVKIFLKYGLSLTFWPTLILAIVTFVRNNYYASSIPEQLPHAKSYYELMNVLSMIPCPFFGLLVDKFCIELVMTILNVCGALMMGLLLAKTAVAQYLSATFQWAVMSFLTSQYFCYSASRFPQKAFGKIVGFVLLVGGNFANVSTPMYNYASSHNNFTTFDTVLMALSIGCIGIIAFLYFHNTRKEQRETMSKEVALKAAAELQESV